MATATLDNLDARTRTTDTVGAAERLDLKPETLANWRYRGEGPPFLKVGRAVRYRLADLDAWLDERTRTSTSDTGSDAA